MYTFNYTNVKTVNYIYNDDKAISCYGKYLSPIYI